MADVKRRRGKAAFSFIHVETFGDIDITHGRPVGWKETLQRLRFLSEPLRDLAHKRWDTRRPVVTQPPAVEPMATLPFPSIAVERPPELHKVLGRRSEFPIATNADLTLRL
jgi:hypothetical protein